MTKIDDSVAKLEDFFSDCVTQTPIKLQFTAAECAAYLGMYVATVSFWLQTYRDVQGSRTTSTAEFTVATYQRGRKAMWFILSWPNMTPAENLLGGELFVTHEIMSVIREDVNPMLRNIEVQFAPAVVRNKRINKTMVAVAECKLDGYRSMLLNFQRDVTHIRPMSLRRLTVGLNAALNNTINRVDTMRAYLAKL